MKFKLVKEFQGNDLMVRFKTGLSCFINRLSLMSNLKLLVLEAKTSKSSKLMTQSQCKRWSEPMLNEERTYVECTELWKNHTGSVYQQYQDLMKHKDRVSRITWMKNSMLLFSKQNKLDFKEYLQRSEKLIDPIWHQLIDPIWYGITVENAWMDNHFVKFQSNQTIFISVKWKLRSKAAHTSKLR